MKQLILTAFLLIAAMSQTFSQSFEVGLATGIGISDRNIDGELKYVQNEIHSNFIPIELTFNYRFFAKKRIKPFVGTGLNYTNNNYFQNIRSDFYNYNVDEINFSQKHLAVPLRLGIDVAVFGKNSIGIQYERLYNFALNKESLFVGSGTRVSGSLDYEYKLTSRTRNFVSEVFSAYLKTQITNHFYMTSSVSYRLVPITGDFDFSMNQVQTLTNLETGISIDVDSSYSIENSIINDDILIFKIGVTYIF